MPADRSDLVAAARERAHQAARREQMSIEDFRLEIRRELAALCGELRAGGRGLDAEFVERHYLAAESRK